MKEYILNLHNSYITDRQVIYIDFHIRNAIEGTPTKASTVTTTTTEETITTKQGNTTNEPVIKYHKYTNFILTHHCVKCIKYSIEAYFRMSGF